MKLKKRAIPMLAGVLTAVMLTSTASAHPGDYYAGKYIGKNGAEILLRIEPSAQTSLLDWAGVYQYGYDWNNISSNVEVSLVYASANTPTIYGAMSVCGYNPTDDRDLGGTLAYDSNGNLTGDFTVNWSKVTIYMNTSREAYFNEHCRSPQEAAKKTFLHEVGHALKLSHPFISNGLGGHTNNGRPAAVMNQGYPGLYNNAVSPTITAHDISCLKAKWGA